MENILDELYKIIVDRINKKPAGSYTAELVSKGLGFIARKVGEECIETIIASLNEGRQQIIYETADLFYHILVLLAVNNIKLDEIYEELRRRMK
jgi:phosphoribosyl-ATP pyrophosphohydrolase